MLVLSRREQQKIRLGNSIVLTVVQVAGDRVRIGIEAPRDILILRDELEAFDNSSKDPAPVDRAHGGGSDRCQSEMGQDSGTFDGQMHVLQPA